MVVHAAIGEVQHAVEPGHAQHPLQRRRHRDEHQAATDALRPAVRLEQQPEGGDVDQDEVLHVDEHLTGPGVDHPVQALPDVGRGAGVEAPAQHEDPPALLLLDVHPLPLLRRRATGHPAGAPVAAASVGTQQPPTPAGAPLAGGRILGPSPGTRVQGPAWEQVRAVSAAWQSYSFLFGPTVALAVLLILMVLLRWTFSRGKSVVARPGRRGEPEDYGLLVPVASPATMIEAEVVRRTLEAADVRATVAETLQGPRVMVMRQHEQVARHVLARPAG